MPLVDVVRVSMLSHLANGQTVENTFHIHKAGLGVPGLTELTNLASEWNTYFAATYKALLLTTDTYYSVQTYSVPDPTVANDPYLEYVDVVSAAGTTTYTRNMPETICAVVSLKTAVAKRYARGHIFAPPCWRSDSLQEGSFFVHGSDYTGKVQALVTKLVTGTGPSPTWTGTHLSGYTLCVFSKQQNKVVGAAITDCSTALCDERVHNLKSRLRGTT